MPYRCALVPIINYSLAKWAWPDRRIGCRRIGSRRIWSRRIGSQRTGAQPGTVLTLWVLMDTTSELRPPPLLPRLDLMSQSFRCPAGGSVVSAKGISTAQDVTLLPSPPNYCLLREGLRTATHPCDLLPYVVFSSYSDMLEAVMTCVTRL